MLQRFWVWGGMLAGLCLRSTSLCYSMRRRGKVSEEALHVGSGCEAFHLETNAFPVQWAFSLSGICVSEGKIHTVSRHTKHVDALAAVNIDLKYMTDSGCVRFMDISLITA